MFRPEIVPLLTPMSHDQVGMQGPVLTPAQAPLLFMPDLPGALDAARVCLWGLDLCLGAFEAEHPVQVGAVVASCALDGYTEGEVRAQKASARHADVR